MFGKGLVVGLLVGTVGVIGVLLGTVPAAARTPAEVRAQTVSVGPREARVRSLVASLPELDEPYDAIAALVPGAAETAGEVDRQYGEASAGSLDGKLLAVKANIDLRSSPATAAADVTRAAGTAVDATVATRVRSAGGVIVAVTNMDTWARGTSTISQLYGSTGNAWNPDRSPFGSSGGAAVAVARGWVDAALGTDTCGSIRLPAAANAIFGLRPTAGAVSRFGVAPLAPTQDVVGPLARDVATLRSVFDAVRGPDASDPLTLVGAQPSARRRTNRLGFLTGAGRASGNASAPIPLLQAAGITVIEVAPRGLVRANVIEDEFGPASAAWLAGRPYLGGSLPIADPVGYRRRLADRVRLRAALTKLLDDHNLDALVYPTTTAPPGRRNTRQSTANCWLAANSGLPALAVPGHIVNGFPAVGVDLLGRAGDEATLLDIAAILPVAPKPPPPPAEAQ